MRERDFFREPLSEPELLALLGGRPAGRALAWRSPRARAMGLDPARPPADDELVRLMLDEPYLLRRPVIHIAGETAFGFDRPRLEEILGQG